MYGKAAYDAYASACGLVADDRPYDELTECDRSVWRFVAAAVLDLCEVD